MRQRIRYAISFSVALFCLFVLATACAPKSNPTQALDPVAATFTPDVPAMTVTELPVTDTPTQDVSAWPVYTLATKLPDSPSQVRLYRQTMPAGLPSGERLAALMKQLKISGAVSTNTDESGGLTMSITDGAGSVRLSADDPLILVIETGVKTPENGAPLKVLPPDVRAQIAKTFLDARGLLDFPYIMEPPGLSRERDQSIRIVPLLDGYPLYDYDPLNGRLLVAFDAAGEISTVFWRPLKVVMGDFTNLAPAATAWDQLVNGKTPRQGVLGQCWQAMVFDPGEPYGVAGTFAPTSVPTCVSWGAGAIRPYAAATITDVKLVYFANDLSLGMSPFAFPADSPVRVVFPMWQFSGVTSDKRELVVLWPAMLEH